jgi:hypothetical protein
VHIHNVLGHRPEAHLDRLIAVHFHSQLKNTPIDSKKYHGHRGASHMAADALFGKQET